MIPFNHINKKRKLHTIFSVILLSGILFLTSTPMPVWATEIEDTISDLEMQQKETQDALKKLSEQKEASKDNVDELTGQSKDLQKMYQNYASMMDSINGEISDVQSSLQETSQSIVSLNSELMQAQEDEKLIYENLKNCLQASYENGSRDSLIMLLYNSSSIKDFLTKAQYVTAFLQYEQDLITSYQDIQSKISEKAQKLEEKQTELDSYQNELDQKQSELADLTQKVQGELSDTNDELASENERTTIIRSSFWIKKCPDYRQHRLQRRPNWHRKLPNSRLKWLQRDRRKIFQAPTPLPLPSWNGLPQPYRLRQMANPTPES